MGQDGGEEKLKSGSLPLDRDVLLAWLCDDREILFPISNCRLARIFCWGWRVRARICSDLDDHRAGISTFRTARFLHILLPIGLCISVSISELIGCRFRQDLQTISCCESRRPVIECAFDFDI